MDSARVGSLRTEEFTERVRGIAGARGPDDALTLIVELVLASIDCDHASITLVGTDGRLQTAASSDVTAEAADSLQYELGEGPCVAAAEGGSFYLIPETENDTQFATWGPRVAREVGLHSVLSLRLFTSREALGALNIYGAAPRSLSEADVQTARTVAAHASVALARARSERNLWAAIDSRHLIGQAQGILMERHKLSAEQAFAVLKRYSQAQNKKLFLVASDLLQTRELPDVSRSAWLINPDGVDAAAR